MPGYLPLCAFRQGLLPEACRSCAWWQTTGNGTGGIDGDAELRRQWMTSLESSWGTTGLLLEERADRSAPPNVLAVISYAPATAVPRLRALPFGPFPTDSALLFCLASSAERVNSGERRLMQKALGQLRGRHVEEVYAIASDSSDQGVDGGCRFFSHDFLEANGFEHVRGDGDLFLMRADLRGLMSLFTQAESFVKRLLRGEPAPSPATWTHREAS